MFLTSTRTFKKMYFRPKENDFRKKVLRCKKEQGAKIMENL